MRETGSKAMPGLVGSVSGGDDKNLRMVTLLVSSGEDSHHDIREFLSKITCGGLARLLQLSCAEDKRS